MAETSDVFGPVPTPKRFLVSPRRRELVFPLLLNTWPVLLLISQKALLPVGLLLNGAGTRTYRRELLIAVAMLTGGAAILILQRPNEYALNHYVGYGLFVLSVPLINLASRGAKHQLLRGLAILSVVNCVLAFVAYFVEIDLSGFRGLNRIIGQDYDTHRVFFETTSLLAVFSPSYIRRTALRW